MSELMRFRVVRAPDRVRPETRELIRAGDGDEYRVNQLAALGRSVRYVDVEMNSRAYAGDLSTMPTELMKLDDELGRAGSLVHPHRIEEITGDVEALVASAGFRIARARLFNTLGAIVGGAITDASSYGYPILRDYAIVVQRLLYIAGLLEWLAQPASTIVDEHDVADALRWRTIVLPAGLWSGTTSSGTMAMLGSSAGTNTLPINAVSRRPAFADLYVVRQDWVRYEEGEVAHIENVLLGERKTRENRRRTESEVTSVTETEMQTLDERDTQTTARYELSTEATREMELALHVEGSVDVKYPPGASAIIAAHVGASVDYSQATSDRTATTTAREAIDRALKRIETRAHEMRTARTLTTVEDANTHELDNKDGTAHVVGIYRWVNKVDRAQVYRYPNRFLLEFQLPEPGAWLKWMQGVTRPPAPEMPPLFTIDGTKATAKLSVADVTETTYADLGKRYGVKAMTPPPAPILRPGVNVNIAESEDTTLPIKFVSHDKFVTPDGYRAVGWQARILSWHNGGFGNQGCSVRVAVGGGPSGLIVVGQWASMDDSVSGSLDNLTGPVAIGVMADTPWGLTITMSIECHRLDAHLRKWQQSVYDMLVDGYTEKREAWERAVRGEKDDASIRVEGSNPLRTRLTIATELKKHIVELLISPQLVGVDALTESTEGEPSINVPAMRGLAPIVSFMEQAFEWENLTYVLYPYFWGARDGWRDTAAATGTDPELAAFLSAGSARVIVPARPGLEQVVHFFLYTGLAWGGLQAPAPDEEGYLSIDKEIRALQLGAADGIAVGESWEVRLPTTLVVLQADGVLPTNPNPQVP